MSPIPMTRFSATKTGRFLFYLFLLINQLSKISATLTLHFSDTWFRTLMLLMGARHFKYSFDTGLTQNLPGFKVPFNRFGLTVMSILSL